MVIVLNRKFQKSLIVKPTYYCLGSCTFGFEIDNDDEMADGDYGEIGNLYEASSCLTD